MHEQLAEVERSRQMAAQTQRRRASDAPQTQLALAEQSRAYEGQDQLCLILPTVLRLVNTQAGSRRAVSFFPIGKFTRLVLRNMRLAPVTRQPSRQLMTRLRVRVWRDRWQYRDFYGERWREPVDSREEPGGHVSGTPPFSNRLSQLGRRSCHPDGFTETLR